MKQFKTHMVKHVSHDYYSGVDDGFFTYCGIDEGCSEELFTQNKFVENYDITNTTCKRCIAAFWKQKDIDDKRETDEAIFWKRHKVVTVDGVTSVINQTEFA